ncbi:FMN-binding protein [Clostridium sp. DL1XJH146]
MKSKLIPVLLCIFVFALCAITGCSQDEYLEKLNSSGYEKLTRLKEYETDEIVRVYENEEGNIVQVVRALGYEDDIEMLFEIDGKDVRNVVILEENETEDYGGYVREEWFLKRFYLPIENEIELVIMAKKEENQVVAITGATITSDAVVYGLNLCIENYRGIKK